MGKGMGGIQYIKDLIEKYPNDSDLGRALRNSIISRESLSELHPLEQGNKKGIVIGVDFDGTCVTHDFPYVGKDIGSVPVLKRMCESGNMLVLWTMRCDKFLADAVNWFKENEIPLWGIQTNPLQSSWTSSPKAYCEIYIDDAALGCPLKYDKSISTRGFVDWEEVESILEKRGVI